MLAKHYWNCISLVLLVLAVNTSAQSQQRLALQACPAVNIFVSRLGEQIPDLGGSEIVDDNESTTEPLGSRECPVSASTQCEKLNYLAFMFALMDMSPKNYRRPGIAAFLANVYAEDSSLGDKCSAENFAYNGTVLRKNFNLQKHLCGAGANELVGPDGSCDVSDPALDRLRNKLIAENSDLSGIPEYTSRYGPIVTRIYRRKFSASNDLEAFKYRGRGFLQITGRDNYRSCQRDVEQAKAYLATNKQQLLRTNRITGVDWKTLDVVSDPTKVSFNRYVAAFCAASYWNQKVANIELGSKDENFRSIVKAINSDDRKASERLKGYATWCNSAQCAKNFPSSLSLESGFRTLININGPTGGGKK